MLDIIFTSIDFFILGHLRFLNSQTSRILETSEVLYYHHMKLARLKTKITTLKSAWISHSLVCVLTNWNEVACGDTRHGKKKTAVSDLQSET